MKTHRTTIKDPALLASMHAQGVIDTRHRLRIALMGKSGRNSGTVKGRVQAMRVVHANCWEAMKWDGQLFGGRVISNITGR